MSSRRGSRRRDHRAAAAAVRETERRRTPADLAARRAATARSSVARRGATRGGEIDWIAPPRPAVTGQTVLVVDDIFDEGYTLQAILAAVRQQGATAVYSAALVNKQHNRKVPGLTVDFIGLEVPDRYVFGCGMDYKEYWRNLPAIYAARD